MEDKKEICDHKMKHFAKLHEKIQTKYADMQKRLEKSKSVDTLTSLKDDFSYKEQRSVSNANLLEPDEYDNVEIDRHSLTRTVIVEEVVRRNARFYNLHEENCKRESESMDDFMIIEQDEIDREDIEYNKQNGYSFES